ncbi:FXYD domain-containing ion transport regulator 7 isoform X2 [Fukomys damarensis]|uniref:FXYD domain-containing ion transport regulator 7 isoform X2 n=1 Tax=Fukomys damarensis TaxID=885580 RepID=UPI0008FEAF3D|nr:FXYD domain-containing ion transport regulator 7 isoform X2 [Fukomys damarensis]
MKRRELSAAPSAVCPPAGGRDTWRLGLSQDSPAPDVFRPPPARLQPPGWPLPSLVPRPPRAAQTSNKTCCSRTFAASASSSPLLLLSMATPTQTPTDGPEESDPFFYDYATVQTVGLTLATIMFLLGIIIIISKKVKCRKADSSPTCKSCKSELPSSAPGGGGV